jgi:hypothetical protein
MFCQIISLGNAEKQPYHRICNGTVTQMRRIIDPVDAGTEVIPGYQQDISPIYSELLSYTGEYQALTQTDRFGMPLS